MNVSLSNSYRYKCGCSQAGRHAAQHPVVMWTVTQSSTFSSPLESGVTLHWSSVSWQMCGAYQYSLISYAISYPISENWLVAVGCKQLCSCLTADKVIFSFFMHLCTCIQGSVQLTTFIYLLSYLCITWPLGLYWQLCEILTHCMHPGEAEVQDVDTQA